MITLNLRHSKEEFPYPGQKILVYDPDAYSGFVELEPIAFRVKIDEDGNSNETPIDQDIPFQQIENPATDNDFVEVELGASLRGSTVSLDRFLNGNFLWMPSIEFAPVDKILEDYDFPTY